MDWIVLICCLVLPYVSVIFCIHICEHKLRSCHAINTHKFKFKLNLKFQVCSCLLSLKIKSKTQKYYQKQCYSLLNKRNFLCYH